jgi:hypothetical protein
MIPLGLYGYERNAQHFGEEGSHHNMDRDRSLFAWSDGIRAVGKGTCCFGQQTRTISYETWSN